MKNKNYKFYGLAALAALLLTGCAAPKAANSLDEGPIPELTFTRTSAPVKVDGVLDDAAWTKAPAVEMQLLKFGRLPREAKRVAQDKYESGTVKFLYDDKYLYVSARMDDSDLAAFVDQDQEVASKDGDMFFLLLAVKSNGAPYWEIGVAPNGAIRCYCYPSTGISLGYAYKLEKIMPGLKIAVKKAGTLNDHSDMDKGWTVEMAIPIAQLEKSGGKFNSSIPWSAAATRYNYSRYLYAQQRSSFPLLPPVNFINTVQYYSPVVFR